MRVQPSNAAVIFVVVFIALAVPTMGGVPGYTVAGTSPVILADRVVREVTPAV